MPDEQKAAEAATLVAEGAAAAKPQPTSDHAAADVTTAATPAPAAPAETAAPAPKRAPRYFADTYRE